MRLFGDKVEFGFSDNLDGNLAFRFGSLGAVNEKRRIFFKREGVDPEASVVMLPEHSNKVVEVSKTDGTKGVYKLDDVIRCDCIYTKVKGLNLLVTVADCVALVIYDSVNEQLAMAHIGVKNLSIGTIREVFRTIKENSHSEANFYAITGPFIKKCCYNFDKVPEHLANLKDYFIKKGSDEYHFDTESALKDQLIASGMKKENIFISELCSMHDGLPSHRRSQKENLPESRMLVYARMV